MWFRRAAIPAVLQMTKIPPPIFGHLFISRKILKGAQNCPLGFLRIFEPERAAADTGVQVSARPRRDVGGAV